MSAHRKAEQYAETARKADLAREWRTAERNYLLAAQELASSTIPGDVKLRRQWDAAAKRAKRLDQLEVHS